MNLKGPKPRTARYDPSNAPPHVWLEHDYYGTADASAVAFDGGGGSGCICAPAPGLEIERRRLEALGGTWLGTCGDANHTYGYHVPACRLSSSDYSMQGPANRPVNATYGCAIDISMSWPAARDWLRWLIGEIRTDRIQGIAEVIGSYNGRDVRYWSDTSGWHEGGVPYTGSGHDTWTHVAIYRSTALEDHRLLAGWSATGYSGSDPSTPPNDEDDMPVFQSLPIPAGFAFDEHGNLIDRSKVVCLAVPPVNAGGLPWGPGYVSFGCDFGQTKLRIAVHNGAGDWWDVQMRQFSSASSREDTGLTLLDNAGKICIGRMKRHPADSDDDAPAGLVLEYGRR